MDALDGNAIAGDLFAEFGRDMTTALARCTTCGRAAMIAELRVYTQAPGTVVRCAGCDSVTIVMVSLGGGVQVHLAGLELIDAT